LGRTTSIIQLAAEYSIYDAARAVNAAPRSEKKRMYVCTIPLLSLFHVLEGTKIKRRMKLSMPENRAAPHLRHNCFCGVKRLDSRKTTRLIIQHLPSEKNIINKAACAIPELGKNMSCDSEVPTFWAEANPNLLTIAAEPGMQKSVEILHQFSSRILVVVAQVYPNPWFVACRHTLRPLVRPHTPSREPVLPGG